MSLIHMSPRICAIPSLFPTHRVMGGCVITSYSIHYTKLYDDIGNELPGITGARENTGHADHGNICAFQTHGAHIVDPEKDCKTAL